MSKTEAYAPADARRATRKTEATVTLQEHVEQNIVTAPTEDIVGKRIEEQRRARKERGHVDQSEMSLKLSVPEVLKDNRLTYRWVNDKATRIYQMQQKDWQVADDAAIAADSRNSGIGTRVERVVNERTTPTVEKGFLMWKPKEFYQEDKAAEQKQIDERVAGLNRGDTRDPQGLSGPESYIPAGGMKIA